MSYAEEYRLWKSENQIRVKKGDAPRCKDCQFNHYPANLAKPMELEPEDEGCTACLVLPTSYVMTYPERPACEKFVVKR